MKRKWEDDDEADFEFVCGGQGWQRQRIPARPRDIPAKASKTVVPRGSISLDAVSAIPARHAIAPAASGKGYKKGGFPAGPSASPHSAATAALPGPSGSSSKAPAVAARYKGCGMNVGKGNALAALGVASVGGKGKQPPAFFTATAPKVRLKTAGEVINLLEMHGKAKQEEEFWNVLRQECVGRQNFFLDCTAFCKLLVILTFRFPDVATQLIRLTLNLAISKERRVLPLIPEDDRSLKLRMQLQLEDAAREDQTGAMQEESGMLAITNGDELEGQFKCFKAEIGLEDNDLTPHIPGLGNQALETRIVPVNPFITQPVNAPSREEEEEGVPKLSEYQQLRGMVQCGSPGIAEYFGHFCSLLHLETLTELEDLAERLWKSDYATVGTGMQVRALESWKVKSKSKAQTLPGRQCSQHRHRICLGGSFWGEGKFSVKPGDNVLLSHTNPFHDLVGEGLVNEVKEASAKRGGRWRKERLVTITLSQDFDANAAWGLSWRLDRGPNRTSYERQMQALYVLGSSEKRLRLWDIFFLEGLREADFPCKPPGSELKPRALLPPPAARPCAQIPPLWTWEGRSFSGSAEDFEDLAVFNGCLQVTGAFSIAFVACWRSLRQWSRVIDFGNGQGANNIFIGNKARSTTLAFHVWSGKREYTLHAPDAIRVDEVHRYLCSVGANGCMRIFRDGCLLAEKSNGGIPSPGPRRQLFVAKSHWSWDAPFHGDITGVMVWNCAVEWAQTGIEAASPPLGPREQLQILAAEEPSVPKEALAAVQDKVSYGILAPNLNGSQREAVAAAVGNRLTLVQGPPGTGKTHVAVNLLGLWAKELKLRPLLATSDSNVAVDNLAEGAKESGLKVVRLGRPEKVTPAIREVMLDTLVREEGFQGPEAGVESEDELEEDGKKDSWAWDAKKQNRVEEWEAKRKVLRSADVICTTTVGAGTDFLQSFQFAAILVDEVAQATEPSVMVPIVLRGAERLVLVGDHCQLPPSVASVEAQSRGLSLSLFGRLVAQGLAPHFLDTQFRMHPTISAFSASEFYDGRLMDGVSDFERPCLLGFPGVYGSTVAFLDAWGWETRDGDSFSNWKEVEMVGNVLEKVLAEQELDVSEIGVISPYSAQVQVLRKSLRDRFPPKENYWSSAQNSRGLEIASVDAFQGREKELIIFSAVRSNNYGKVGFLADWRRLNVMLTRARRGLVVVGNMATLSQDLTWGRFVDWANREGLMQDSWHSGPKALTEGYHGSHLLTVCA